MNLLELRITNFRSFTERKVFRFPVGPGLYFMWGRNDAESRLEANGSGKSSVWEAITWLFFNKTSRGLKAGDAANWTSGKAAVVELDFSLDDGVTILTLRRCWSPNKWELIEQCDGTRHDLTRDETNPMSGWLRLEFQPFLACVLLAQSQPMFLDFKAEAKATLFAEVMSLDRWLGYSKQASTQAEEADQEVRKAERTLAGLEGRLESAIQVDTAAQMAAWEASRHTRSSSLEKEYAGLISRHTELESRLAEAKRAEDVLRLDLRNKAGAGEALVAEIKEAQQQSDFCRLCEQRIDNRGPARVASDAKRLEVMMRSVTDCRNALAQQQMKITSAEREIAHLGKTLDSVEDRAEAIDKEVNPFASMHAEAQRSVQELKERLEVTQHQRDRAAARHSLCSSWIRWFKEIRLGLMSEALVQLEIEVNSCVMSLGLLDWELRFDIDKETKSGGIQRGFTVSVLSPHNTRPVPWEAWSGGESQRLRIAAQMGLANLIRARTGASINIEVWDEPTEGMSSQGVTDLLDSLASRAEAECRQVWVADHHTLGYAGFTGSVGVVKTEAGSHFDVTGLRGGKAKA